MGKEKIIHQFETKLPFGDLEREDNGQYHCFNVCKDDSAENGIFVKFCSWDENLKHIEHDQFINRKVRITIETID